MKTPSSDEFPITFEKALRLSVGGRDVPGRFRLFREWWRSELARVAKFSGRAPVDNTNEIVELFRNQGVDKTWFGNFLIGLTEYKQAKRSERFRNLANIRWRKKSPRRARKKSRRKKK